MFKYLFFILTIFLSITILAQTVVVSTTQTNYLVEYIDNPVKIVVENYPCTQIVAKATYGKLEGDGCEYVYTIDKHVLRDTISVGVKKNDNITWISKNDFEMKSLDDPTVSLGGKIKGKINKAQLMSAPYVMDYQNDFEIKPQWEVTGFSMKIIRNNSVVMEKVNVQGYTLPGEVVNFIGASVMSGDKIVVDNISVMLYKKDKRLINSKVELVFY
jgi:hypothetical protein